MLAVLLIAIIAVFVVKNFAVLGTSTMLLANVKSIAAWAADNLSQYSTAVETGVDIIGVVFACYMAFVWAIKIGVNVYIWTRPANTDETANYYNGY